MPFTSPTLRSSLVAAGTALLVVLPALPASAAPTAAPVVTAVTHVPTHVGKVITVTGSDLDGGSAKLAGLPLTLSEASPTSFKAAVPVGATTGDLVVTNAVGDSAPYAVTVLPAPEQVGPVTATVGDHLLKLVWSGGGNAGAVVRDVTSVSGALHPTDGRLVASSGASATDTLFTNTAAATYAVWARDSDDTFSDEPRLVTVTPVAAVPTSLSIGTTVSKAAYGATYGASGTFARAGIASARQKVQLLARTVGTPASADRVVRNLTTDAKGVVRTTLVSTRNVVLTLRFAGDAFSTAARSASPTVAMLPRLSAAFSPGVVVRPETTVFSGRLSTPLPGATVKVQRRISSGWGTAATVKANAAGAWSYSFAPGKAGVYSYRAVLNAAPAWLGAVSPTRGLRVDTRNLSAGLSGDDVLALKRQLAALHYVPGALDRSFGYDLTHAVMAFQKVELLPVTGRWTRTERVRVGRPHAWAVRHPAAGRAVEIDITRQVLVLSEAGRARMIVDVSTGTERPYTYKGERDVAHTPRGRFSILRKIDGIRVSKLGELYRPSYFYQGWAIHGSGSVPNYPASHGCVRITNPNADRLFPLLVKGTPVTLYDT
jgi:N-acetylmuramoyl-L-alanine amidase